MILVGSQRGGARDLALHLMKAENEHVEVFEVRGFASNTLNGAFTEAYALSKAGQCRKFLFSLSVNPPTDARVATDAFVKAIDRAEKALGLDGQPRAIVFHEKKGRRHAHAVWSRIRPDTLKAVHLPFTKRKLVGLTRELFIEHGWRMPDGLIDPTKRNPRNFTLAEWQQAQRQGKDPRAIKKAVQDAWSAAKGRSQFETELGERGFWLARGDRRGFVLLDHRMEIYSLPKVLGVKVREIKEQLGEPSELNSVDKARQNISHEMGRVLDKLEKDLTSAHRRREVMYERRREALVTRQRGQRAALQRTQALRQEAEFTMRQARFRRGLAGIWDRLRGEHARTCRRNEQEAEASIVRDRKERDDLVARQLAERSHIRVLKFRVSRQNEFQRRELERSKDLYPQDRSRSAQISPENP
jgi:hypothetical protein